MRIWRDEAKGIFRPTHESDIDATNEETANAERAFHSGDDQEDDQVLGGNSNYTGTAPSGPSSPDPNRPRKSYFDNIPTSSPGGALGRDYEMAEDERLDDSDDEVERVSGRRQEEGTHNGVDAASTSRHHAATSEAGFNDADLTFDLDDEELNNDADEEDMAALMEMEREQATIHSLSPAKRLDSTVKVHTDYPLSKASAKEDNFDEFDFGEEEEILRAMEKATKLDEGRYESRKGASSFYPAAPSKVLPKAVTNKEEPPALAGFTEKTSKNATGSEMNNDHGLSYDDENEIPREKEQIDTSQGISVQLQAVSQPVSLSVSASTSTTTSASTATTPSNPSLEFDPTDGPESDEEFMRSVGEAEILDLKQVNIIGDKVASNAVLPHATTYEMVEEEDLYAP